MATFPPSFVFLPFFFHRPLPSSSSSSSEEVKSSKTVILCSGNHLTLLAPLSCRTRVPVTNATNSTDFVSLPLHLTSFLATNLPFTISTISRSLGSLLSSSNTHPRIADFTGVFSMYSFTLSLLKPFSKYSAVSFSNLPSTKIPRNAGRFDSSQYSNTLSFAKLFDLLLVLLLIGYTYTQQPCIFPSLNPPKISPPSRARS
mmetsp:Transcript_6335/g.21183  ORF Transcript_6335/g.21183 Transcript_6335/m.21183 type:complete len:201 (+) Transcript_6335:278-880(+)